MLTYYKANELEPLTGTVSCPECDSTNTRYVKVEDYDEYYVCKECHYEFVVYYCE